jgi:integrase
VQPLWAEIDLPKGLCYPVAGQQREKRAGVVLELAQVQEFVAEARERHALMTTKRARRYQRGSICKSQNGAIWYGKYYPTPGAPQKRVQLGRCSEVNEKQARTALDDMMAVLNRNPAHALGAEPVRRFVEQVYIPQKYENADWRKASGREAEYLFRRSILPEIGELCCRDLKAEHLRAVLRKLAGTELSYESVSKVRFAMGDMVKRMVAEEYLTYNIAAGLRTPKTARRSDRSRLRRVTLAEYVRAWSVLDERERLAFDLVTFCGLRESEVYGLKNGDLFQQGAIRIERSWYRGEINSTKTDEVREVGVGAEIFERLVAWIATLPEGNKEGWIFPSERIVTPLLPDNVLRRSIYPRLEPLGLDWINFAVLRRSHSTLHQEKGTDPKIIADQQGHGLGVHLATYIKSSVVRKQEAVTALWSDFRALRSGSSGGN